MGKIVKTLPALAAPLLAAMALGLVAMGLASPAGAETLTRTSSFEYDAATGLLTQETIEPGIPALSLTTTYTYDAFGNKLSATVSGQGMADRIFSSTYDPKGQFAITNTNALGQKDTNVYDSKLGAPISLTAHDGLAVVWAYDSFGRKILETRANGTKTSWTYLFCSGLNGGTQSCPQYGAYVITETPLAAGGAQNGPQKKTYHDKLNRVIAADTQGFDGVAWIRVSTEYDAQGRQKRVSKPYFLVGGTVRWTSTTFDALGRPLVVTMPDNSQSSFTYQGLVTTETNSLNQPKITTKNGRDLVISVEDALNGTTLYSYDAFDNLKAITDPAGNVTTMTYDIRGRKTAANDPDMGAWSYTYNVVGDQISQTDAKSQVTTFAYDLLGRMTQRVEGGVTTTWTYDQGNKAIGKLSSISTSAGYLRTHTYDGFGRPATTVITIDGVASTFSTAYDANGRPSEVNYPSGLKVKNVYTALGYLQQLKDGSNLTLWTANIADAEMNILKETAGNGVETNRTFDAQTGFLERITAGPSNSIANLEYAYDTVGNVLTRTDHRQGIYESFDYDDINRLTDYVVFGGTSKYVTYDLTGNITHKSDVGTYTYGPTGGVRPHGVQSIAGTLAASYLYDLNGNMTSGAGRTLTWTAFNMPLTIAQGANTISFAYNGEHERIKQVAGAQTTFYLNDPTLGAMTEKIVGGGGTQWNDYLMAGGKMVGVRQTLPNLSVQTRYFVADHLGSVSVITDDLGAAVERLSYDPWGKRRFDSGWVDDAMGTIAGLTTTRGFTGHEHLDKVGLVHMNGRVYDPTIGRFISADPTIQNPTDSQTLNRYHYARNNPLAYVDPTGYGFFSFFKKLFKKVIKFFKSGLGRSLLAIAASVAFSWAAPLAFGMDAVLAGVLGGAIGGAISTGSFQGALLGAVSAAFAAGAASAMNVAVPGTSSFLADSITGHTANVLSGALMGCAQAASSGGKCGQGALGGAVSSFAGPLIPDLGLVGNTVARAALGGAASVAGGGKFKNAAITGAFGYLFTRALEASVAPEEEYYITKSNVVMDDGTATEFIFHTATGGYNVDLLEHEWKGGHTIALHVGKKLIFLRYRLQNNPKLRTVSMFESLGKAKGLVNLTLNHHTLEIIAFLETPEADWMAIDATFNRPTGISMYRKNFRYEEVYNVMVVIDKSNTTTKEGFLLKTAYPF